MPFSTYKKKSPQTQTQSKPKRTHLPCPCGQSTDAYTEYDDGHGYCFGSCGGTYFPSTEGGIALPEVSQERILTLPIIDDPSSGFTYEFLPLRGISKEVMEQFGVLTKIDSSGKPVSIGFPYGSNHKKIRLLDEKKFVSKGEDWSNAPLFGQNVFSSGSGKAITITEGELDALSVYQMLGPASRVVSVRSASSAPKDCASQRDYLNSFEQIYLCFDNDEPGQKACREVARLFDYNKVYHVKLSKFKDANEYLTNGESETFKRIWWNSKRYLPEGVISSYSEFETILDESRIKEGTSYPFPQLTEMTYGLRTGEVVLVTALEGIGKTEIIRAIEYHLLKTTDDNIAIIHLEEPKDEFLQRIAGYELGVPAHLPGGPDKETILNAIKTLTKRDERLHLYSHFGSADPDVILDVIRELVSKAGCRWVFLDHITMVVSGLGEDDERKILDYLSTRLRMLVNELDFGLILVSHINDGGLTRGSRNISKIANCWIALERNLQADTELERNITYPTLKKNRKGARTGPAGKLFFDLSTFRVEEVADNDPRLHLPPVEAA